MQRDKYWDILKGVAILLVVLGHSIEYGSGLLFRDTGEYFNNPLFLFIYSFHMPLFMAISGFFFFFTASHRDGLEILKNKVRTLLVPILFFTLFNSILAMSFRHGMKTFVLDYLQRLPNTLWFLWDLLIFSLIKVVQNKCKVNNIPCDVVVACALCLFPNYPLGSFMAFMYPFFCLGYYSNKYSLVEALCKNNKTVMIVSLFCFIALLFFFKSENLVYVSGTCVLSSDALLVQIWRNLFRILLGAVGTVAVISVVKYLISKFGDSSLAVETFAKLGLLSMGIYCFQDISLCLYHHFTRDFAQPNIIFWSIAFIVIFVICVAMTVVTKRIGLLNEVLLGGR